MRRSCRLPAPSSAENRAAGGPFFRHPSPCAKSFNQVCFNFLPGYPAGTGNAGVPSGACRSISPKTSTPDGPAPASASSISRALSTGRLSSPLVVQARRRPFASPQRQNERPLQIPQAVGDHARTQPRLVRTESAEAQAGHFHRLPAFPETLLRRSALVAETHHRLTVGLQVGHE